MSDMKTAPEEGILELATDAGPLWLWAFTCPTPGCSCREATVLGTTDGREALTTRGAPVRDAWQSGTSHAAAAAQLTDVAAFVLDLDDGEALALDSDDGFDFGAHPEARAVFDRVDGDVLEAIGRLWYRGKGWPNPEETRRQLSAFKLEGWQPGDLVSWADIFVGVRRDLYSFGERLFEAEELYCVAPGCECGDVVVDFIPLVPRGAPEPGSVRVARSGATELVPEREKRRERLSELWDAFRRRHPKYRERFARRTGAMQEIASRVEAETRAPPPGRTKGRRTGDAMMYFDVLFPELARSESRVLTPINNPDLPSDTFLLRERYCNERDCDCRRVLLEVHSVERRTHVATLNYSFEPAKPPFEDEPQLFVDPLNPQSELSSALQAVVGEMLNNDAEYRNRLIRHYEMWKVVVDDPRHPDHPKVRSRSHDEPGMRPAFPKGEPARREGPKIGPNDPCRCGSGKKYKKCCRN